jgi:hypothetical protein
MPQLGFIFRCGLAVAVLVAATGQARAGASARLVYIAGLERRVAQGRRPSGLR